MKTDLARLACMALIATGCGVDPCTTMDNGDGTYTLSCPDSPDVTLRNGTDGTDGMDGTDGTDGMDGTDGADGADGMDLVSTCSSDADCDDGLFCNGTETCNTATSECVAGTAPSCADSVDCTWDICDEGTDMCVSVSDQSLCESYEVCVPTSGCEGAMPPSIPECQVATWGYGRSIDIVSTGVDVADATIPLLVDTADLIADSKMESDCADLRFVDGAGNELPYWIESGCDSAATNVWVRIGALPFGTTRIYMQYGSSGATAASDAATAFLFYDGFESGDLAGWTAGAALFDMGHDQGHEETASTTTTWEGTYSARLRGDASCFSSPFDGVQPYIERSLGLGMGSYCVDFATRQDITGFTVNTTANMMALTSADGVEVDRDITACSGSACTATGTWEQRSAVVTDMDVLRLSGWATDCADGNTYFDQVRVRGCSDVGDVNLRMYSEISCP